MVDGPTHVLIRMVLRTEATAHSRRQGYYHTTTALPGQHQQPAHPHPMDGNNSDRGDDATRRPRVWNFTLQRFLSHGFRLLERHQQTPRRVECMIYIRDVSSGIRFVLIPLSPRRDHRHQLWPQVVGLVRLPRPNANMPEPYRTLVHLQIANRAAHMADQIDHATTQQIAWHVVPARERGTTATTTTAAAAATTTTHSLVPLETPDQRQRAVRAA